MRKRAYNVQMSFEIPDSEKRVAQKAEVSFQNLIREIQAAMKSLDAMYEPFKSLQSIDSKQMVENRPLFRRYKRQVFSKFRSISKSAYKAVSLMKTFSSDTSTSEMMTSFIDAIDDLQKQVLNYLSIFENLNSSTFLQDFIASTDAIKKRSNQVKQLITDRILEHIDSNILSKDWISSIKNENEHSIEGKIPLIVQLFRERQNAAGVRD